MRFTDRLARFFYGRNGPDQFSRFVSVAAAVCLFISFIISRISAAVGAAMWYLSLLGFAYSTFRMLSRSIERRRAENARFLRLKERVVGSFLLRRDKFRFRKDYRFFKCPSCRTVLRVPRGKGKIRITCHRCGELFIKKT